MTTSDASARKLSTLLKRLRTQYATQAAGMTLPETWGNFDPAVHQVVYSMLLWEASSTQARTAHHRLREHLVDYNELRVCMPDEIAHIIGEKYPRSTERALRLRSILADVFRKVHQLSLAHLASLPKREARAFLDSLDGMPRSVASRVMLLTLEGHATPCDDRLRDLLVQERVIPAEMAADAAGSWLEHHIRAEDATLAYAVLQAWSDDVGGVVRVAKHAKKTARPAKSKARPGA
ncbi:MAG: hypothetical protein HBSAPP03_16690 [Phycisphaerae bacterium]|nr:MAG: hypothetical protein HBSAPP03_16690 [Phycisphaerae bacterium]